MTKFNVTVYAAVLLTVGLIGSSLFNTSTRNTDLVPLTPEVQSSPAPAPTTNVNNKAHTSPTVSHAQVKTVRPDATRTVFIEGVIEGNVSLAAEKIKSLGEKSKEPIFLLLNSPGGSVLDGALVISAIEASPAPVYTVCLQLCASMAAMIHQYGHKRMMVNRSILMFHDAAGGVQGYMHHMVSRINQMHNYVHKMDSYVSKRAGIDFERYLQEANRELWLDAEDATNLRLNDQIVNVIIPEQPKDTLIFITPNQQKRSALNFTWE